MSDGAQKATSRSTFHLAAGLASGFTSSILLQPADLLKTRVQQSRSDSLLASLRQIFKEPNPVRQLWRGTLPSVVRTSLGSAMYFSMLNEVRRGLAQSGVFTSTTALASTSKPTSARRLDPTSSPPTDNTPHPPSSSSALPKLTATGNLLSGAAARVSVGLVVMPITVLKVRFESSMYAYNGGLVRAAAEILRVEGLAGFFKGFGATALRDAPYAGLYVLFYEKGKAVLSAAAAGGRSDGAALLPTGLSISTNFLSGALSAALATALTNPPDAVKTRLQLQPLKYRNMVQATALMWREERWRSFFDGLGLRMARKALSSALAWTVYEEAVRWGERRMLSEAGK